MGINSEDIKLQKAFREALSQKFTGLTLTWIEYEILRQVPKGVNTMIEISNYLEKKFVRNKYSQSQYYRIIKNLVKDGFLEEAGRVQKRKILKLTVKGSRELGYHQRYILDYLQEATVLTDISKMIMKKISKHTGCLRNKAVLGVASQSYALPYLMDACLHCDNPVQELNKPIFLALPDAMKYVDIIHEGKIQFIDSDDPYDWLPKNESMDVIVLIFVLNVLDPVKIIAEAKRVLKPGGHLICLEVLDTTPDFILQIFNDIIANEAWAMKPPIMSAAATAELFEKSGFNVIEQSTETVLISTLAQKQ